MRIRGTAMIAGLCLVTVFGCSRPAPPSGRWQGAYATRDVMIVARLEIDAKGNIYLSAPDATDLSGVPDDQRATLRAKLSEGLEDAWSEVEARQFDFDGHVFRKPGGVAPQLEWDGSHMTAVVYLGMRPAIRVPLRAVQAFSADPWSG
jgi:hypothetical protein